MRYRDEEQVPTTAREQFETYTNAQLKQLLRLVSPGSKATRKDLMIAEILPWLEQDRLPELLGRLTPIQRDAVAEVAWSKDGRYDAEQFEAKYGNSPWLQRQGDDDSGFYGLYGERELTLLDLLIGNFVMPADIRDRLRGLLPKPAKVRVEASEAPPDAIEQQVDIWDEQTRKYNHETEQVPVQRREMERAAMHNLRALLRLVEAGKVNVTEKNHWPTPSAMRQVLSVLEGGDYYVTASEIEARSPGGEESYVGPIVAFAWPLLVRVGGLAEYRGGKLVLTKDGRAALSAEPHVVIRKVWERWASEDDVDELRRINVIRGQTGKGQSKLTSPAKRREVICYALRKCPVGKWIEVDRFSRFMQAAGHRFEVTTDEWTLYVSEAQYGSLGYQGFGGWNILQLRYILVLLMEYAAPLGLADVAYISPAMARLDFGNLWGVDDLEFFSRYDGLMHFRLTGLGAYCLGMADQYAPPPREARSVLEVMPNLTIKELVPLEPADRMMLEAFAEKTDDRQWHLDRDKSLAAIGEGRRIEDLEQFLRSATEDELPERVIGFIGEVVRHADAFSDIGPARLFRCNDQELLATVLRHPATAKHCMRMDENLLVVPEKGEAGFRKAMRTLGFALPVA